jgi:DNA polymerase (family X)
MINKEIAKILNEMAILYEIDDIEFKPRAYENASEGVESYDEDITKVYKKGGVKALTKIPGVGKGIAEHLESFIKTNHFKEYERMKKKLPVDISELRAVEGVGPKFIKVLWKKLKVKNLVDLERVAKAGKISKLPHFGEKSEKKVLKGIEFLKKSGGRRVLGFLLSELEQLEQEINEYPEVERAIIAGSARRRKETIGDIDILAISSKPELVMERFVKHKMVQHVYARGKTKTLIKFKNDLDVDLRVVPRKSFGAALNYFTGSKDHNVALREIAIQKKWKLNEYGLWKGKSFIAGRTEEEIYKKLGLGYIEPELRENNGEIEASLKNKLPALINHGSIKGDLQVQTDWTDGDDSIEEMANSAEKLGLQYIAITDHTKSLAMTGGADEKKLLRQMKAIDNINKKFHDSGFKFQVLKGAEVNIMKDGLLDIDDETLSKLDIVGAAVHSHFKLTREEQTKRIIRAMENPHVDIIFHLSGRIINRREPIELDVDSIITSAKRTGTVLEIDAYPDRSDIKAEHIRKCVEQGVKMSIDSDAHSKENFSFLEYGISQARRGGAQEKDIINSMSAKKLFQWLWRPKTKRK